MTTQSRQRSTAAATAGDRYAASGEDDRHRSVRDPRRRHRHRADQGHQPADPADVEEHVWGLTALLDAPEDVAKVHRSYIDVGCDVDLHQHVGPADRAARRRLDTSPAPRSRCTGWTSSAAPSASPAGGAAMPGARDEVAVAFSLNGDVDTPDGRETIGLLSRAFEEEPPDLILLETLSLVRSSTYATVEALLATGIPVWLSFRRCRHGVCGVYGEHWGGPEGDSFGRAARRFEEMGVGALAINCIPPDHVAGMLSWLRDFTDLPLGVYPNLGYLSAAGWREEPGVEGTSTRSSRSNGAPRAPRSSAAAAACGPSTCAAARAALDHTKPGHERPDASATRTTAARGGGRAAPSWADPRGRDAVPARHARDRGRHRRLRPDPGQLPDLEVPVPGGDRRPPALPGHRLRLGHADGAAGAQRRRARARDRHRPSRGQEHAHERVSQRCRRPGHRRRRGPLPVGARGALRRDRRQPLPDAGRPVRAGRPPTARSTTGAATCSTT